MKTVLPVLFLSALLSGCASVFSNSAYPVFIDNLTGTAEFVIKNHNNVEMGRGQTPALISLASGAGYFHRANYFVHFSKPGFHSQAYLLPSHVNGWYWGNVVNILGFLIDPATGAMWRLPEQLVVKLPRYQLAPTNTP